MSDRVLVTITDGIADVRFNRADKRNALDGEMFLAIAEAGERLKTEPGVRAVVLSRRGCVVLRRPRLQLVPGDAAGADGQDNTADGAQRQPRPRSRTGGSPTSASRSAGCGRRCPCR